MKRRAAFVAALATAILSARVAAAAPSVWAIDDGEKIKEDATDLPFETGQENPVWSPGAPIRLFALRDETVAFQVIVEADDAPLEQVTVDLDRLAGPRGARLANAEGATDPTRFVGRRIERFVEHYLTIARPSGGETAGASLAWAAGSGPPPGAWTGRVPDALVPVEAAPPWAPYPMHVAPHTNAAVWIDVTVPRDQPPGTYAGDVVVRAGADMLATLRVELEVVDAVLPDRITKTMLYYDRDELDRRIGGGDAVEQRLWQLFHRHRLTPMHDVASVDALERHLPALDGTAYTAANGYEGAAEGLGDDVVAIGAYGQLGAPSEAKLGVVLAIADRLAEKGLLGHTDAFVYAIDEDCASPYGRAWKELLAGSKDPNAKHVRVAWTCSEDPTMQPVDVAIQLDAFDASRTAAARAMGKEVWVYNGVLPHDGAFVTDVDAVSPRANGWIGGMLDIGRWFYWETTFWYDDNKGGHGAYDPFAVAETFHNDSGDHANGDGVLIYPGKQVDAFGEHSIGMDGVVASIRLKNWRRGIEDAGYYQLARAANRSKADAIAAALVPRAMSAAREGSPPSWPNSGKAFFEARRALLSLIPRGQDGGGAVDPVGPDSPGPGVDAAPAPRAGCGCRRGCARGTASAGAPSAIVLAACVLLRRRRRSPRAGGRRRGGRGPSAPR